jgi:hypothetical protein
MYIIMEKTQLILYISCRSIEYIYIKKAWTLSHIKKLLTVVHGLHTYKQIYIHTYKKQPATWANFGGRFQQRPAISSNLWQRRRINSEREYVRE